MGCCGEREKQVDMRAEQKWDYINLSDFKSTSCFTPFSYGILYISLLISVAVYGVDTFTAINLLVFNRWSGQIKPIIPFGVAKWIFAGCIILSWVLLVFRWIRAVRVMQNDGVAESFLDPLAVRIQSIRVGQSGRGWRRFLVFAELTKSKKGTEYVALYTHFSFEAWLRIVFAQGPRQVINALTLYSVMQANLIPQGSHAASHGHSAFVQFFVNVEFLADSNQEQAVILFSMLFTLVIWVFSALSFMIAVILYLLFLWHHIPSSDGGLTKYCKRKIDNKLSKIVGVKVNKALEKQDALRTKEETKAILAGERIPVLKRQPTIPVLAMSEEEQLPGMPPLSRQTTQATVPPYTTRPPTREGNDSGSLQRHPTLPDMSANGIFPELQSQPSLPDFSMEEQRPFGPSRSTTESSIASNASYRSNAPLMGGAGSLAYGPPGRNQSPAPPLPSGRIVSPQHSNGPRSIMNRSMTGSSQGTQRSPITPGSRPPTSQGRRTPGPSPVEAASRQKPGPGDFGYMCRCTPGPSLTTDPQGRRPPALQTSFLDDSGRRTPATPGGISGRATPAPSVGRCSPGPGYESRSQIPASTMQRSPSDGGYVAYRPNLITPATEALETTFATPSEWPIVSPTQPRTPYRNVSTPLPQHLPPIDYFNQQPQPQRSGTAPLPRQPAPYDESIYDSIYDSYAHDNVEAQKPFKMPPRAATASPRAGPGGHSGQRRPPPSAHEGGHVYSQF
ncbi:MAG: hypothetical protein M1827_007753 [Pycnora praestabilis]|nr:MAG: hypothetical protein M1827_007753 [Pycnora praestabilis]